MCDINRGFHMFTDEPRGITLNNKKNENIRYTIFNRMAE